MIAANISNNPFLFFLKIIKNNPITNVANGINNHNKIIIGVTVMLINLLTSFLNFSEH